MMDGRVKMIAQYQIVNKHVSMEARVWVLMNVYVQMNGLGNFVRSPRVQTIVQIEVYASSQINVNVFQSFKVVKIVPHAQIIHGVNFVIRVLHVICMVNVMLPTDNVCAIRRIGRAHYAAHVVKAILEMNVSH